MIEYEIVLPPFDDAFIERLYKLGCRIFGEIDREDYFAFPLQRMPDASVQLARNDAIIGFKFGYALTPKRYYSALGGVAHEHRRAGLAHRLMKEQHAWVEARGYRSIETGVANTNEAMLSLNVHAGFRVIGSYSRSDEPRIMMLKELETASAGCS